MTKSETDRTTGVNQTEIGENRELVRMVVESSAECTKPFKKLPEDVQAKIIDGMTEVLTEDELRFRGKWNREGTDVYDWKIGTRAALYTNPNRDSVTEKEVKITSTGLRLVHLIVCIADDFNIDFPELLKLVDPVRRVFQRSADTLEAGFTEYAQIRKYRGRAIGTSFSSPGQTRSTNPLNPHCVGRGRNIL